MLVEVECPELYHPFVGILESEGKILVNQEADRTTQKSERTFAAGARCQLVLVSSSQLPVPRKRQEDRGHAIKCKGMWANRKFESTRKLVMHVQSRARASEPMNGRDHGAIRMELTRISHVVKREYLHRLGALSCGHARLTQ